MEDSCCVLLAKGLRGDACEAFETAREMALIGEAEMSYQCSKCLFILEQQVFSLLYAAPENILMGREADSLFKAARKVIGTHPGYCSQFSDGQRMT